LHRGKGFVFFQLGHCVEIAGAAGLHLDDQRGLIGFPGTIVWFAANHIIRIWGKIEEQGRMTYLKVLDLCAAKRDSLLRIQAEITNTSQENQQLYYRFKW